MKRLRQHPRSRVSKEQLARVQRMALRVAKLRGKSRREHQIVLADYLEEIGHPSPNALKTGRKVPERWVVFNLDVWGNEEDGWLINDMQRVGSITVRMPEMLFGVKNMVFRPVGPPVPGKVSVSVARKNTFLQALKREHFLQPHVKANHVWWEEGEDEVQVNARGNDQPLFILRRVDRDRRAP